MEVINYSILRNNLKEVLDKVSEEQETYIVNRGSSNAVIISLNEYNSWQETMYLLSTEANRKSLESAIDRDKKGEFLVSEDDVDYIQKMKKKNIKSPFDISNKSKGKQIQKVTGKEFVEKWKGILSNFQNENPDS